MEGMETTIVSSLRRETIEEHIELDIGIDSKANSSSHPSPCISQETAYLRPSSLYKRHRSMGSQKKLRFSTPNEPEVIGKQDSPVTPEVDTSQLPPAMETTM
ncbi:unnamed protein product [Meganyctiphanes norvegica]|uniref:Uncharacterized protein n=1 Tax=Meganyctiphanes norvegica TaxID=48144 RepID=A0AAV2R1M5_MEGNR